MISRTDLVVESGSEHCQLDLLLGEEAEEVCVLFLELRQSTVLRSENDGNDEKAGTN